jgi:maltooligosyltrehalose trehalohydrolase
MEKVESRIRQAVPTVRRLPIGAEVLPDGGVSFRVWAPKRQSVQVVLSPDPGDRKPTVIVELEREMSGSTPSVGQESGRNGGQIGSVADTAQTVGEGGYFSGIVREASDGMCYGFLLDGDSRPLPDPASRFQPSGPDGLSRIVDHRGFTWSDATWKGITIEGQVIYELHIGTLTPEGTWAAATDRLEEIAAAGMTVIEVMPVADFLGAFGWGYDGVCMFAPTRLYGEPDDFRRFVDRAHALGLGVILDVVYNHFGLVGCTIAEFTDDYFSRRHKNEWGSPINFDGENCGPVREFFQANVAYWIEEFHLDGFRFDATQSIFDDTEPHILTQLQQVARKAAGGRALILLAENEPQNSRLVRPVGKGGHGFDAMCNDDFHHAARVRLTGLTEAYYDDFAGSMEELRSAVRGGFLYQGQFSLHQNQRRGAPARGLPATAFIHFLQNHDQGANSGAGLRIHQLTSPGRLRAMTALWLLSPQTPMFFQGQEFCASTPFCYFADFSGKDGEAVAQGRINFLSQFPSLNSDEVRQALADPADPSTFARSKLDWSDRERHRHDYELHKDLLTLRREDPIFRRQRADQIEAAALTTDCLALRYFDDGDEEAMGAGADRLVIVNFGRQFCYWPVPSPLLAPPQHRQWELLWTSDQVRYGASSTPAVETEKGWHIPAEAAVVLRAVELCDAEGGSARSTPTEERS